MKTNNLYALIVVLIVLVIGFFAWQSIAPTTPTSGETATSTATVTISFDHLVSDGAITVPYSSAQFGLATNKTQIVAKSYIPPCNEGFAYCLYYIGTDYQGTNFEAAGIRISKRADLTTERLCLETPPSGFDVTKVADKKNSKDTYASSMFLGVGDAGAGHSAAGSLYRLFVRSTSTCYEFETRIGQTQYANYPAGTINEFTTANRTALQAQLQSMIDAISLTSGEKKLF